MKQRVINIKEFFDNFQSILYESEEPLVIVDDQGYAVFQAETFPIKTAAKTPPRNTASQSIPSP